MDVHILILILFFLILGTVENLRKEHRALQEEALRIRQSTCYGVH